MSAAPSAIRSALRCQERRLAAGLCIRCGDPRGESMSLHYCADCHGKAKTEARNRYRARHGIPFEAPLHKQRKARAKHQLCLELEAAFRRALSRLFNLKAA